jgi:hypothetical protein
VNTSLLQRQAALAGVALLAVLGALALARDESSGNGVAQTVAPAVQWRTALVGIAISSRTMCQGVPFDASTRGIVHPVLPCGVKLVVRVGGRSIRTEVVGQGPGSSVQTHEFNLTPALAAELGLREPTRIRWRFAG